MSLLIALLAGYAVYFVVGFAVAAGWVIWEMCR